MRRVPRAHEAPGHEDRRQHALLGLEATHPQTDRVLGAAAKAIREEIPRLGREELLLQRREAVAEELGQRDRAHSASIPRASAKSFAVSPPSECVHTDTVTSL